MEKHTHNNSVAILAQAIRTQPRSRHDGSRAIPNGVARRAIPNGVAVALSKLVSASGTDGRSRASAAATGADPMRGAVEDAPTFPDLDCRRGIETAIGRRLGIQHDEFEQWCCVLFTLAVLELKHDPHKLGRKQPHGIYQCLADSQARGIGICLALFLLRVRMDSEDE